MAQAITAPGDVILVPTRPIRSTSSASSCRAASSGICRRATDSIHGLARQGGEALGAEAVGAGAELSRQPTAVVADLDFYREVVAFAKKHDLIVLSDLAYAEIYFDGEPPPSILQVPGAMDIAVEFTTLSKTYAMPGWRMGFAVGNERLIDALARVKSYLDYGAFTPIQVAAAAALNGPQDCIDEIRAIYKRRRDCLVDALTRAGWPIPAPPATMFAWAPIPEHVRASRLARVLQAAAREGRRRGLARRRLRRVWRGLCAHRAGRERAAHPPGRAQHPEIPRRLGQDLHNVIPTCLEGERGRSDLSHDEASETRARRARHGRRRAPAAPGRAQAPTLPHAPGGRSRSWPSRRSKRHKNRDVDISGFRCVARSGRARPRSRRSTSSSS